MASVDPTRGGPSGSEVVGGRRGFARRMSTETKQAFKTTEFWVLVVLAILILIAANAIEVAEGGPDYFRADKAWLYITILGAAYMIARGLAKAGAHEPFEERPSHPEGPPLAERVKAAATVLTGGSDAPTARPGEVGQPGGVDAETQVRQRRTPAARPPQTPGPPTEPPPPR
jgi:hypothetical protein